MTIEQLKVIPASVQNAITDAFKVQLGSPATIRSMRATLPKEASVECMSIIEMKSSQHSGSMTLGFPKETFLAVLEKMIGEKYTEITPENNDGCAEILNIIFSSARKNINEAGFDFSPSIPSTVSGNNLSLALPNATGPSLFFDCSSEFGPFSVVLSLRKV